MKRINRVLWGWICLLLALSWVPVNGAVDGNRLAYLGANDPFYVSHEFPKLTLPQWLDPGESAVDAVVVLAIDDLKNNPDHFEDFLRPLLDRLKAIDGRAPVSIMTVRQNNSPLVQRWLAEGVNLDAHTWDHPCPLFHGGDFAKARATYDRCLDALLTLPNNRPVAFRMPCLDIWNTTSPRFYSEIFSRTTAAGGFLKMSSSVQLVFSADDPSLPRELVKDEAGRDRFTKYFNQGATVFGRPNYQYGIQVLNYPYPIVVGGLCWEIPALVSDHTASQYNDTYGRRFLRDWEAAIDATVLKRGIAALCFHASGRTKPDEMPRWVDRIEQKYGERVKYLNFAEVQERLDRNLLAGHPLRTTRGGDNGVRLLDVDNDGYLDVIVANEDVRLTRVWSAKQNQWLTTSFPVPLVRSDAGGHHRETGVRFGVLQSGGRASFLVATEEATGVWHFDGTTWQRDADGLKGLRLSGGFRTVAAGRDRGVRLRDLDGDGRCEVIVSNEDQRGVFRWISPKEGWRRLPFGLPSGTRVVDGDGREAGLRFLDLNGDRRLDVLFSDDSVYSGHEFVSLKSGWSKGLVAGRHGRGFAFPHLALRGTNSGAWVNGGRLWMNNEFTDHLPNHAVSVRLDELTEFARAQTNLQLITRWLVLGPFPNEGERGQKRGFATDFGPEKNPGRLQMEMKFKAIGGRMVGWQAVETKAQGAGRQPEYPKFDLPGFCRERNFRLNDLVVYLAATLDSAKAQDAKLLLGSEDGIKVWLNGELVHSKFVRRRAEFGSDRLSVRLRAGKNLLLVKLEQIGAGGALIAALIPERKVTVVQRRVAR